MEYLLESDFVFYNDVFAFPLMPSPLMKKLTKEQQEEIRNLYQEGKIREEMPIQEHKLVQIRDIISSVLVKD